MVSEKFPGGAIFGGAVTFNGTTTSSSANINTSNNGTPGTGITAVEYGDPYNHVTILTFNLTGDNDIDFVDGADATVGVAAYTLPEGFVQIKGTVLNLSSTTSAGMLNAYELAFGTADGTDAASADIAGTEEDIIAGIAVTNGATQAAQSTNFTVVDIDGHSSAGVIYLNVAQEDAGIDVGGGTVALTGTAVIHWTYYGDY